MNFDHWFIRTAAYVAFGLFVFLTTLLVTFPDGRIAKIAAVQMEAQLEKRFKQNYEVEVDDFDLWWLWGGELEGITVRRQPAGDSKGSSESTESSSGFTAGSTAGTKPDAGNTKQKTKSGESNSQNQQSRQQPLKLTIDSAAVRLAPLSSLTNGALALTYSLGIGNGTISGTVVRASDAMRVSSNISAVKLSKIEFIKQYTGVPFFGDLNGDISLEFMPNSPVVKSGDISINGNKLQFGPKPALKVSWMPIDPDIPSTNLGNLDIRMNISSDKPGQPVVRIEKFDAKGRDIQRLQVWGRIELGARLNRTRLRLTMRTKFRPAFVKKNNLGPILQIKQFRNGQRGDWYGFILVGYLNNLNFKGASAATTGPGKQTSPPGGAKEGAGGGNNRQPPKRKLKQKAPSP